MHYCLLVACRGKESEATTPNAPPAQAHTSLAQLVGNPTVKTAGANFEVSGQRPPHSRLYVDGHFGVAHLLAILSAILSPDKGFHEAFRCTWCCNLSAYSSLEWQNIVGWPVGHWVPGLHRRAAKRRVHAREPRFHSPQAGQCSPFGEREVQHAISEPSPTRTRHENRDSRDAFRRLVHRFCCDRSGKKHSRPGKHSDVLHHRPGHPRRFLHYRLRHQRQRPDRRQVVSETQERQDDLLLHLPRLPVQRRHDDGPRHAGW